MPAAIPGITRLQDAHDVNVTLGAGVDEYRLCYDNGTGKFVLRASDTISLPYGSFSSSATQGIAATNAAYAITYTDTEATNGVTLSNSSRINIVEAGTYLISFSAVGKSAAPNKLLDIWLSVNGTNVARSNTLSKFVGSANERIITVTFIYSFTAGQYFELYMHSDDTGTSLVATAAGANPTRPASPSIITTVNMISVTA